MQEDLTLGVGLLDLSLLDPYLLSVETSSPYRNDRDRPLLPGSTPMIPDDVSLGLSSESDVALSLIWYPIESHMLMISFFCMFQVHK